MNITDASKINPPQSPHSTSAAKRIIVVDDDTQVRKLFRDLLTRHGYEVHEADDAPTALQAMEDTHFDLVISDVQMPGVSGVALLREIKRMQHGVPVIVVSGVVEEALAAECIQAGAGNVITKPVDIKTFLPAVAVAIESASRPKNRRLRPPQTRQTSDDRIDQYNLVGKLGEGGMGVVHLAERANEDGPGQYALKILKTSARGELDWQLNERFRREIAALSKLDHPNIVSLVDHGVGVNHSTPYFVMEYVNGRSLKLFCTGLLKVPLRDKVSYVRQLADALSAVHQAGLLHRDLKPDNVLVLPNGQIKLMDFGIAGMENSDLTQTGQLFGTFEYMAPETRAHGHTDERSDVFSIGAIAYELLTQIRFPRLPPGKLDDYIAPEPPRDSVPDFPVALESLLAKMLRRDPADRYPTAMAIVNDIDICLQYTELADAPALAGYKKAGWNGTPRRNIRSAIKSMFTWQR